LVEQPFQDKMKSNVSIVDDDGGDDDDDDVEIYQNHLKFFFCVDRNRIEFHLLMLALFTYEFVLVCDDGIRRFCPPLFNVRVFDAPPVVVQLLVFVLYTGERR
jgi:hypothetical protein